MQTKDRKENPLLNRVEIEFSWNHEGKATPSRSEILNQVASLEPGANKDLIVIKNVNTRFGVGITTGLALIYGDEESIKVEPKYVHSRFEELRSSSAVEEPAEEAPAEEESADDSEGGDE